MYEKLKEHTGHAIDCVTYGDENVAIECLDCNMVLIDFDRVEEDEEKMQELDPLACSAENIINDLLDIIENSLPELYSSSNEVLKADKWLAWFNGELMDEEIKEFFDYPKKIN